MRRGAWARVTIDRRRNLSLCAFKKHRSSSNIFSDRYHATINVGDTAAIAQRTEAFVADGSRGLGQAAFQALMQVRSRFCLIRTDNHLDRLTHGGFSMQGETAEALRKIGEALRVAPEEPDHYINQVTFCWRIY